MEMSRKPFVEIFADGACSGNPGVGGYGVILRSGDKVRKFSGCENLTTNNRMELVAAIEALNALDRSSAITVVTDSAYVKGGITEWLVNWKRRGWRTAAKSAVKNEDLWRRLDEAAARHDVTWEWVKGHAGHPENERADELARAGMGFDRIGDRIAAPRV